MPKLRRPDGRIVSVSEKGVEALKGRGYTDPEAKPKTRRVEVTVTGDAAAFQGIRPSENAPKAEWVAYAESRGVDPTDKTKAELVDRLTTDDQRS